MSVYNCGSVFKVLLNYLLLTAECSSLCATLPMEKKVSKDHSHVKLTDRVSAGEVNDRCSLVSNALIHHREGKKNIQVAWGK